MTARPLASVRVLDASSYVSGPFAALLLADMGADVVKVEPATGDPYRRFGPQDDDGGVMFRAINRNKRSVAVDLTTTSGVARFQELLEDADILITNWRPGVAERFGLEPEAVRRDLPRLIWVRISGYGQDGPMASMPAFDAIMQARTGTIAALGDVLVPTYLADKVTAMMSSQAAVAALFDRNTTGKGAVVDVAMIDSLSYFNTPDLYAGYLRVGERDERVHRQLRAARFLPTRDGSILISPVSGHQLKRSLIAAGMEDRIPEFKAIKDPTTMSERFFEVMADRVVSETTDQWLKRFTAVDVPVTAVFDVEQHFSDPQVEHNNLYSAVEESEGTFQRRVRFPALFDGRPIESSGLPCPSLGS